ncbi:restriction endonuclease subunit S [Reichenbachiella sp. MALMAid0571]|uniref:restriction endonuclease subunit S n=1 Tax=Reichenbachiella sp. MALMAid0571 TaxID=3143939 RepID=UPI0032DE617D
MGNLNKVPTIRFPEFKDAWQHKKLSEFLKEAKKRNGDLKYGKEHVLSVSGELGIVNQIEHLGRSYAGVSVHQYHVVEVGDIVYTKSPLKANPFGIIKLNKDKAGIVSTLYAVYNVKEQNAYGPFLDYYFSLDANTNRYLRPLVKKGAKNDMKINNAYVLHDRIFAPSIPEQKRIATFFTVLDKKITQLKEKKAMLEQYKKGVMQKLFTQELRFKDENGKEFPEWDEKNIGEIFSIFNGYAFSSNDAKNEGVPWVKIADVGIQEMKKENLSFLPEDFLEKHKKFILRKGDYVIALTRPILSGELKISVIDDFFDNSLLNQRVGKIVSENNTTFIYYMLQQSWLIKAIENNIAGTDPPNLSPSEINYIKIEIPKVPEQRKIAQYLSSVDRKIQSSYAQLVFLKDFKKGLIQRMFCN